jgi:integrase
MKNRTGYLYKVKKGKTYKADDNKVRGAVYYLQYRIGGKLTKTCLHTTDRDEAEGKRAKIIDGVRTKTEAAALQERIDVLQAEPAPRKQELQKKAEADAVTIAEAWDAFKNAGNRDDIAESTMTIYEYYWRRFEKWLSEKYPAVEKLRDVTFEIAESYKAHLTRKLGVSGKTFNEHRSFLLTFFNVLTEKAHLTRVYTAKVRGRIRKTTNVWEAIARKKHPKRGTGRDPLTTDELIRVCGNATGELRAMLAIGLYLGARMGDAATLAWGNVDMHKRLIRYTPRKLANTNDPPLLEVPMHPTLYSILAETPVGKRKGHCLPVMAELYLRKSPAAVSRIVQGHFTDCGLVTTKDGNGSRKVVSRGFHSLRHSAVSIMREAGTAQTTSQAVVGHNTPEIHELYSHTDAEAMRRAVYALPSVTGGKVKRLAPPEAKALDTIKIKKLVEKLTPTNSTRIKKELIELLK